MRCVAFSNDLLPDLTRLLNAGLAGIPPGWVITEGQVATTIASVAALWHAHYPENRRVFWHETFCVLDSGRLVAAAQWGCPSRDETEPHDDTWVLFWVISENDSGAGVQLILEELEKRSRAAGCGRVVTSRFSFGVGWLGIPATLPAVLGGFLAAGFTNKNRWVILTSPVDIPKVGPPGSLSSVRKTWLADVDSLEWDLRLDIDVLPVGECSAWGIPKHFSGCKGFSDWVTIEWLGVEPVYRRQGIGKWLMVEQLHAQAERGVRHAILWTEIENQAILGLCEALGFKRGPECWEFEKSDE